MLFFDDLLIELLVGTDATRELFFINAATVLLESADETAIVLEHLAVEAKQVVVLIYCVLQFYS
jgi:hypothetical protein